MISTCLITYWLLGTLNTSFYFLTIYGLSERSWSFLVSYTHSVIFVLMLLEVFCCCCCWLFISNYVYERAWVCECGAHIGKERVFHSLDQSCRQLWATWFDCQKLNFSSYKSSMWSEKLLQLLEVTFFFSLQFEYHFSVKSIFVSYIRYHSSAWMYGSIWLDDLKHLQ